MVKIYDEELEYGKTRLCTRMGVGCTEMITFKKQTILIKQWLPKQLLS